MGLGNVAVGGVAVGALALAACGQAAPEDPGAVIDRHMESLVTYFNDMADAIATVTDQSSANELAQRFQDEFIPRLHAMADDTRELQERYPEGELGTAADTIVPAWSERMDRAFERYSRQADRLDAQPQLVTSALEEAVLEWSQLAQHMEVGMNPGTSGGSTAPGSGEWCQQMARKPQAQWTMEESLAFANQCTGR
jgi:hypothetical protein